VTELLVLELDFHDSGRLLESLAERLVQLETMDPQSVDEDRFADLKNDALALAPLYRELRHRAFQAFGPKILSFSPVIQQLDDLYRK
jgi:hypothetical protein